MNIMFYRVFSILTDFFFNQLKNNNLLNRYGNNCFMEKMKNATLFIKMGHSGWGNGYAIPYIIHVIILSIYQPLVFIIPFFMKLKQKYLK